MKTNSIDNYLLEALTPEKLIHTEGVVHMAIKLAKIHGANVKKARIAAKYHDLAKCFDDAKLNSYVKYYKLPVKYLGKPNLSHGKVAAEIIKYKFNITDEEILDAIRYHTTLREDMTLMDKIIYVADAIEVNRVYDGLDELRELAYADIDKACIKIIDNTIERVNKKGGYLDQDTLKAKEYYEKGGI